MPTICPKTGNIVTTPIDIKAEDNVDYAGSDDWTTISVSFFYYTNNQTWANFC